MEDRVEGCVCDGGGWITPGERCPGCERIRQWCIEKVPWTDHPACFTCWDEGRVKRTREGWLYPLSYHAALGAPLVCPRCQKPDANAA